MQVFIPIPVLIVTYLSLFLSKKVESLWLKGILHVAFIILSLLLMSHSVPGFNNIKLFDGIRFSKDSLPFTMYLNFDKAFVAIVITLVLGFGSRIFNFKSIIKSATISLLSCLFVLLSLALAIEYIRFDPKLPMETWIWALNNLLIVCASEELFFRRYIQGGLSNLLSRYKWGHVLPLLIAAALFGLAHYKGGIEYVLLSMLAGLFYGFAYYKTKRVEASILTHFGLNCVHFILFSYPALI